MFESPKLLRIALKICDRAIELEGNERRRFIEDLCSDDPELLAEVENVLGAIQASDGVVGFFVDRVK